MNLYPRTTGGSPQVTVQHDVLARRILDRVKKGEDVRPDLVDWALTRTGDSRPLSAAEAAHFERKESEMFAGMDEMGDYADGHLGVMGVGR